jgi:hypothetical protein
MALGSMATTAALRLAFDHRLYAYFWPPRAEFRTALLFNRCRARDRDSIGAMFDAVTDDDTCPQAAEIQGDM